METLGELLAIRLGEGMLMSTNNLSQRTTVNQETLARKAEFVILSILVHYRGRYQDSLVDWYSALRLGLPQLTDTRQLEDVFKRLSDGGIIELDRPTAESSRANRGDGICAMKPFMTTLTPVGMDHWNTIRIQPG
jgi:hypothetical protein